MQKYLFAFTFQSKKILFLSFYHNSLMFFKSRWKMPRKLSSLVSCVNESFPFLSHIT